MPNSQALITRMVARNPDLFLGPATARKTANGGTPSGPAARVAGPSLVDVSSLSIPTRGHLGCGWIVCPAGSDDSVGRFPSGDLARFFAHSLLHLYGGAYDVWFYPYTGCDADAAALVCTVFA